MVVYTRLKYERTGINTQPAVEEVCQNVNLYLVLGIIPRYRYHQQLNFFTRRIAINLYSI